jgi:predicted transposase YbfD/YdcC
MLRNEITAIPTLLEKPAQEGCIVTIDAMGCQYKTVGQVVQQKTDYLFSLKKNSDLQSAETLYEDVQEYFKDLDFSLPTDKNRDIRFQSVSTHDEKYGRIEDRDYAVSEDVAWLVQRHPYMTITIEIKRPHCHSHNITRNGKKRNGKQNYRCTQYGCQFIGGHEMTYRGCLP